VSDAKYKAQLSKSQGRPGWSVIFKHPKRLDRNTNKPGMRVRQGLSTDDDAKAAELRDQLNELLADESFWNVTARPEAERRFDKRVVEIFYYGMDPEATDFLAVREAAIPLPDSRSSDYRRVLLLGTTGAGKTTLLRQLIGSHPRADRFPSTSTAKTTVHDIEVVLADGRFRAVTTFFPMDEVREHLNECISEAVLAAYRKENDHEVLRKLLMHVNQRFRFNYVLGNGAARGTSDANEDDEDETPVEPASDADERDSESTINLDATNALLARCLREVRAIAARHGDRLREELGASDEKDQRVIDELFEEELDRRLREDEAFHVVADDLMDEIALRFSLLKDGKLVKNTQGWPQSWSWETDDRKEFMTRIGRFASNYAPHFGRLLTPLVNGVRVAGPFGPAWDPDARPKFVFLDGEGLGHTPKTAAVLSTGLTRRIAMADAIVLVDNAAQPMQAAPVSAMRELVAAGAASKLLLVFTHFDVVKGDNLANNAAKEEHILASAENVLAALGEELGPFAERALRERLQSAKFFVGSIDEPLEPARLKSHRRTVGQLEQLISAIDNIVQHPAPVTSKPVYDRLNLALAAAKAAEGFRNAWWPRLGLSYDPGLPKEHWKRVWALSRRLSNPDMGDEYDDLRPVADLNQQLQERLFVMLQSPVRWGPSDPAPSDEMKLNVFNALAAEIAKRVLELASRRIRVERMNEWVTAFGQSGRGSSFVRARIIGDDIYARSAPIPDVTPSPDKNAFLHEVAAAVAEACEEVGAVLT